MATDGDEALEALEKGGVDILLLDINMPRLNGIDACSMWRQIEGGRQHLPIIGVTADATSETELRCQNAGMDLRNTKRWMPNCYWPRSNNFAVTMALHRLKSRQ